jgi:hypothetical protein
MFAKTAAAFCFVLAAFSPALAGELGPKVGAAIPHDLAAADAALQ